MANSIYILVFVMPVLLVGFALLSAYFQNKFVLENADRHRLALRNVVTGRIEILNRAGLYFRMPWWILDTTIELNKEAMETDGTGLRALSSDGVEIVARLRWNLLAGRRFNRNNGQFQDAHGRITDDKNLFVIDQDSLLMAITKTDFAKRHEYVRTVIAAVIDSIVGGYTAEELLFPSQQPDLKVPKAPNPVYNLQPIVVKTRQELLGALSMFIYREVNYRLRDVGFNVDEVDLQGLDPADQTVQQALDRLQINKGLARSTKPFDNQELTDREKMAIGTSQQGEVARAQATISLGKSLEKASETIVKGLAKALRNIGKENQGE